MKFRHYLLTFGLLFTFAVLLSHPVRAQEPAQEEEEEQYVYGEVVSAASGALTVKQTEEGADPQNKEFVVTPETEFYNLDALEELKTGEMVEVYYLEKEGRSTATYVAKEELEEWEDEAEYDYTEDTE